MEERLLREQPKIARLVAKQSTYRHGRVDVQYLVAFEGFAESEQEWYSAREIRNRYEGGAQLIKDYETEMERVVAQERREQAVAFAPLTQEPWTQHAETPSQDVDLGLDQLFATPRSPARIAAPVPQEERHFKHPASSGQTGAQTSPAVPWQSPAKGSQGEGEPAAVTARASQRSGARGASEVVSDAEDIYDPFPALSSAQPYRSPTPAAQPAIAPTSPPVAWDLHRLSTQAERPAQEEPSTVEVPDLVGAPEPSAAAELTQPDDHFDPFPPLAIMPGSSHRPSSQANPAGEAAAPDPGQGSADPQHKCSASRQSGPEAPACAEVPETQQESPQKQSSEQPSPPPARRSSARKKRSDQSVAPVELLGREQPGTAARESELGQPQAQEDGTAVATADNRQTAAPAESPATEERGSSKAPGKAAQKVPKASMGGLMSLVTSIISQAPSRSNSRGSAQPPQPPQPTSPHLAATHSTAAATSTTAMASQHLPTVPAPVQSILPTLSPPPQSILPTQSPPPQAILPTSPAQQQTSTQVAPVQSASGGLEANTWSSLNAQLAGMVSKAQTQSKPATAQGTRLGTTGASGQTGPRGSSTQTAPGRCAGAWQLYLETQRARRKAADLAPASIGAEEEERWHKRHKAASGQEAASDRDAAAAAAGPDSHQQDVQEGDDAENGVIVISNGDEDGHELGQELRARLQPGEWRNAEIKGARKKKGGLDMQVQWGDGFQARVFHTHLKARPHCLLKLVEFYESKTRRKRLRPHAPQKSS